MREAHVLLCRLRGSAFNSFDPYVVHSCMRVMQNPNFTTRDAEGVLETCITFPGVDGVFERLEPLTDFRKDVYEARILFMCRRKTDGTDPSKDDERYVLKCKIQ